jgi:hypothetical protein
MCVCVCVCVCAIVLRYKEIGKVTLHNLLHKETRPETKRQHIVPC